MWERWLRGEPVELESVYMGPLVSASGLRSKEGGDGVIMDACMACIVFGLGAEDFGAENFEGYGASSWSSKGLDVALRCLW